MKKEILQKKYLISSKFIKKLFLSLIIVTIFEFILSPAHVFASEYEKKANIKDIININTEKNNSTPEKIDNGKISVTNNLPESDNWKTVRTTKRVITAYNSEVGQCDNSPCITANGFNVCEHGIEDTVAANWLKFGTKIRIPEIFGDRVFVVRDRMNTKHNEKMDIWMIDKQAAISFGVKVATIEILEP